MLFIAAILLSIWFWRRNMKDAGMWMIATYAGLGFLFWNDYASASTMNEAVPTIVRDFILIGMVGLVQSLAVAKRIPIWVAVILILGMFTAAHFLKPATQMTSLAETTTEESMDEVVTVKASNDPQGEFLVEVKEGAEGQTFRADAFQRGWKVSAAFSPADEASTYLDNYFILDVTNVASAEKMLSGMASVAYFEPNEIVNVEPLIEGQAGGYKRNPSLSINDPETEQQWAMEVLNMEAYYSLLAKQSPKKQAKIAILDTGVDGSHEDIRANYFSVNKKYDNDPMGHGTHCAGIAAGVTNNGIGIGSLAGTGKQPFVQVTSVKVLGSGGMGTQKSIIAGIIEAVDEGADVISLSLGGPSNSSRQKAYSQAVKYAHDHNAIVIAAAGNSNRDSKDYAPANARGMITVAALDQFLLRAPFSNKVNNVSRGIAAPGVGIYSTTPNNNYKSFSGTSMACPFVAGLLGVMKSVNPELTADQAYKILKSTGIDGKETRLTGRIVQPAAALQAALK